MGCDPDYGKKLYWGTWELYLARDAFCYYDRNMKYGMHDGDYKVMIGTSCEDIAYTLEASVRSGRINLND